MRPSSGCGGFVRAGDAQREAHTQAPTFNARFRRRAGSQPSHHTKGVYTATQTNREPVAVNPAWDRFFEGDATFQILCRQMGVSSDRLIELLERH